MAVDIKIVEEARVPRSMDPKKFGLWLFMATVVMLFGAWTSAYIVKRGDMGWSEIVLPDLFFVNTGVILVSSVAMVWAVRAAKRGLAEQLKIAIAPWATGRMPSLRRRRSSTKSSLLNP